MNVLVVFVHPEPASFTGALRDTAVATLRARGHTVEVSDLHAEGFDPAAGRHDFTGVAEATRFHYQAEQQHAAASGGFAPDLAREQARVARAELMVFVFPLWWGGVPGMLKGWFDRVLAYGFAYADGKRFDSGFFRGRRALLGLSTGGTPERFSEDGVYGPIERVLYPVRRCVLEYLGLEVLEPFVAYASPRVDDAARARYLEDWADRLRAAVEDPQWHIRLREAGPGLAERIRSARGEAADWTARR